eukprot:8576474-Karenia_brevis.AAC.1
MTVSSCFIHLVMATLTDGRLPRAAFLYANDLKAVVVEVHLEQLHTSAHWNVDNTTVSTVLLRG